MEDKLLNSINYKIIIPIKRHYFWNSSHSGYIYGMIVCIAIYIGALIKILL